MGIHIANTVIKLMAQNDFPLNKANVLVLGITFKENCPDIRNSRVVDVVKELRSFGTIVDIYDPLPMLMKFNTNMILSLDGKTYEEISRNNSGSGSPGVQAN